jgi:solute carrier family 26 (sodium-independent sulfate anion transporter), member 11
VIVSPNTLYEFWKINPSDVLIFLISIFVTVFVGMTEGIYAAIALSLLLLLSGIFKAHGKFLGGIKVQMSLGGVGKYDKALQAEILQGAELDDSKRVFLPLDKRDGTNSQIPLERPYPGIFIYRLTEGFNYANAANHLDSMMKAIREQTQPTVPRIFDKPGVSLKHK